MKNNMHIKIYFLVGFLFIIGLVSFIFNDFVIANFRDFFIEEDVFIGREAPIETISSLEIVEKESIKNMERKALYFNFDKAGRTPPIGMEDSRLPIFNPVFLGNNQPFR